MCGGGGLTARLYYIGLLGSLVTGGMKPVTQLFTLLLITALTLPDPDDGWVRRALATPCGPLDKRSHCLLAAGWPAAHPEMRWIDPSPPQSATLFWSFITIGTSAILLVANVAEVK
jgi:hypothetical protein